MVDIIAEIISYLGKDLATSIFGGIIAGIILSGVFLFLRIKCYPYILKKAPNFNRKEKTLFGLHVGALILVIIMLGMGIVLVHPFIQGHTYMKIPDGEEYQGYRDLTIIALILGLPLLGAGYFWLRTSVREMHDLWSSVKSRKNKSKEKDKV